MIVGADFDKIEFKLFGFDLVEPNALIGDIILTFLALFFAFKVKSLKQKTPFFNYWYLFFISFAMSFFIGGLGHSFYNYWGIKGKYFSWFGALFSMYFIEMAFISIESKKLSGLYKQIATIKLLVVVLAELAVVIFLNLEKDPHKGLAITAINTGIGSILCLGILGRKYQIKIADSFKYFWIVPITMVPAGIFQSFRISIYPWLDRNDISHILLLLSLILYWKGIQGYNKYLQSKIK